MPAITPTSLTKRELVVKRGLEEASFDYALPTHWVETIYRYLHIMGYPYSYDLIISSFVWVYDDQSPIFGRPVGLTPTAHYIETRLMTGYYQWLRCQEG